MAGYHDTEMPIALRKPKRKSSVLSSPVKPRVASDSAACVKTPSTRRSKRVHFSDPSLFSPSNAASTFLTPAFRRSSLATPKQRRPATPGRPAIEGTIQFTPFTQALDERCQRRIRRNRLSEELNKYESEKKSRAALQRELQEKEAELDRLRAELEATKAAQLVESQQPPPSSQERFDEIEAELEVLRQSFSALDDDNDTAQQDLASWDDVPHVPGPSSEGGDTILIHEDEDADPFPVSHRQPSYAVHSDAMTMNLELEAARQAKTSFLGSFRDQAVNTEFDFHFADSPARRAQSPPPPPPPQQQQHGGPSFTSTMRISESTFFLDLKKQLKEATARAEEAELALTALDIEISALGFGSPDHDDTMAMVSAISSHFRTARVELERLVPGETTVGFEPPQILPEILAKTRLLSERLKTRENELKAAKDQHHNLKNNFEKAIIAAEKANDRIRQLETAIDSNAEECLHIRMRSQQLERDIAEKEKDVTSLSNALNKYRSDICRLEDLINNVQAEYGNHNEKVEELEARIASEATGRRAAEVSAVQRLARINELENILAESRRHTTDLEARLSGVQNTAAPSSQQQCEEIAALNSRISSLAGALATANAEVERLKVTKLKLEERVRSEAEQGAKAVETLQEQLIRTVMKGNEARKRYVNGAKVRIANWELDDEREEALSSDGATMVDDDGEQTPSTRRSSLVKFAEWAEVETFERETPNQGDVAEAEESGSESVPGSVEVHRGRGKYRKVPRLVTYDRAKRSGGQTGLGIEQMPKRGKRKYDSGIGMDSDFEIYDEERDTEMSGAGQMKNGMMTPELSSDGDVETEREADMVDVL